MEEISLELIENIMHIFNFLGTKETEDKIYEEIRGRIKEEDLFVPSRKGSYYYYKKTLEGKEYVQHCRRLIPESQKVPSVNDIMPTGPEAPHEHVILDENIKAQNHPYYSIGAFEVTPYHYQRIFIYIFSVLLPNFRPALILFLFRSAQITSW